MPCARLQSPGRTDPFRVIGYPSRPDRSYMLNEQFTWLTPFSQQASPELTWCDRSNEDERRRQRQSRSDLHAAWTRFDGRREATPVGLLRKPARRTALLRASPLHRFSVWKPLPPSSPHVAPRSPPSNANVPSPRVEVVATTISPSRNCTVVPGKGRPVWSTTMPRTSWASAGNETAVITAVTKPAILSQRFTSASTLWLGLREV